MNPKDFTAGKFVLFGLLYVALFAGQAWLTWAAFTRDNPSANDFYPRWAGGCRLLREGASPYSSETTLEIQRGIYGREALPDEDQVAYAYPIYTLALTWPTCLTRDYAWVQAAWMTLLLHLILVGTGLTMSLADWSPEKLLTMGAIVWSAFVYPNARALLLGQLSVVVFFLLILSLLSVVRKRDATGGVLLALTTIKPQMMLLTVPWLLMWSLYRGRHRFAWGFGATFGGLIVGGMVLVPDWPAAFVQQIQAYTSYTEFGSTIWIMTTYYLGTPSWIELSLSALVVVGVMALWWRSRRSDPRTMLWVTGATLLATHLVSPRTATTHFIVFLLPLFLIFEDWHRRSPERARYWVGVTLLLTLVGSWLLFLLTVQGEQESALNYLPIPIALAVGLWSVRSRWLPGKAVGG